MIRRKIAWWPCHHILICKCKRPPTGYRWRTKHTHTHIYIHITERRFSTPSLVCLAYSSMLIQWLLQIHPCLCNTIYLLFWEVTFWHITKNATNLSPCLSYLTYSLLISLRNVSKVEIFECYSLRFPQKAFLLHRVWYLSSRHDEQPFHNKVSCNAHPCIIYLRNRKYRIYQIQ